MLLMYSILVGNNGRLIPVSYTHLDVYKRQIQYYFILSSTWIESSSFATKKEPLHTPTFAGKEINPVSYTHLGVTCWAASLHAQSGLQCDSTMKPSKPKSIACWQRGATNSRLPPIWLGSQKIGSSGMRRRNSIGICH